MAGGRVRWRGQLGVGLPCSCAQTQLGGDRDGAFAADSGSAQDALQGLAD
jgi:hypothetical protein